MSRDFPKTQTLELLRSVCIWGCLSYKYLVKSRMTPHIHIKTPAQLFRSHQSALLFAMSQEGFQDSYFGPGTHCPESSVRVRCWAPGQGGMAVPGDLGRFAFTDLPAWSWQSECVTCSDTKGLLHLSLVLHVVCSPEL